MGRWQSVKTCRLYIDQAVADRADMRIKPTKMFRKAQNVFHSVFGGAERAIFSLVETNTRTHPATELPGQLELG